MTTVHTPGKPRPKPEPKPSKDEYQVPMTPELREAMRLYQAGKIWSPLDVLKPKT